MKYPPITWELMEERTGGMGWPTLGKCQRAFIKHVGKGNILTRELGIKGNRDFYWDYMSLKFLDNEDNREWEIYSGNDEVNTFFDLYLYGKLSKVDKIVAQCLK